VIGSLRGSLLERTVRADHSLELLVETGGVGYRVQVPAGVAGRAGDLGGPVFLYVHTHVREDALVLYGFSTREERDCFELLLGAHGVGPSLAVSLLSALSPVALRRAVADEDLDALTVVPGVGKKTAARLVLDLATRFAQLPAVPEAGAQTGTGPGDGRSPEAGAAPDRAQQRDEVKVALGSLGYGPDEVRQVLARLPAEGTAEELLRHALRELAGRV
jgi:Holliday junction DNA helicase RuvA